MHGHHAMQFLLRVVTYEQAGVQRMLHETTIQSAHAPRETTHGVRPPARTLASATSGTSSVQCPTLLRRPLKSERTSPLPVPCLGENAVCTPATADRQSSAAEQCLPRQRGSCWRDRLQTSHPEPRKPCSTCFCLLLPICSRAPLQDEVCLHRFTELPDRVVTEGLQVGGGKS